MSSVYLFNSWKKGCCKVFMLPQATDFHAHWPVFVHANVWIKAIFDMLPTYFKSLNIGSIIMLSKQEPGCSRCVNEDTVSLTRIVQMARLWVATWAWVPGTVCAGLCGLQAASDCLRFSHQPTRDLSRTLQQEIHSLNTEEDIAWVSVREKRETKTTAVFAISLVPELRFAGSFTNWLMEHFYDGKNKENMTAY